jgi:hypothetical protein
MFMGIGHGVGKGMASIKECGGGGENLVKIGEHLQKNGRQTTHLV